MSSGIATVAVIGAGTMGHGIAQVAAAHGCVTRLFDVDADALSRAVERVRSNLDKGVSLGKVSGEERGATLANLSATDQLAEAVRGADLVIEAVPEVPELKARIFAQVREAGAGKAILATNTSSLSIGDLAQEVARPERFIGLHFFNPVHIMKLVEVVWGPKTADDTRAAAVAFVRRIGKEPVVVKDSPGFASSRLGVILGLEAMRMVEEGVAAPEAIDTAMELGYRHPMGPLRLTDLVGLDVRLGIAEYLHEKLGSDAFRPPEILRRMVAQGKLGKKSGHGFYDWSE
jgi:3-hydroxybutyryl-CoA dehydrogenase